MYANGTKAQLDDILINKKWKNSAIDCATYNTSHLVSSDHKFVTIKCRLCLRVNKSRKYSPKFDWSKLMCNKDIKEKLSIEIKNRFKALQSDNSTDNDPNTMYNNIIEANQYAASETIPIITKIPSTAPWHSQLIEVKRNAVSQAIKVSLENPSPDYLEQIRKASEELDYQYKKKQDKYVKNKIAELNNAHTNKKSKIVWQIANEISNRKKSKLYILKGKSKQDRLNQWKNHFSSLLGQAPPVIIIPTKGMIDLELHIEKMTSP